MDEEGSRCTHVISRIVAVAVLPGWSFSMLNKEGFVKVPANLVIEILRVMKHIPKEDMGLTELECLIFLVDGSGRKMPLKHISMTLKHGCEDSPETARWQKRLTL